MGVGCARHKEVETMLERQQTKGLLAVEVIAQQGDAMRRSLRGMFGQPAFASGTFTGLLVMPVLRHAVRWRQGKDLWVSRAHNHRGERGVIREGGAIAELTPKTVGAMHSLGRQVVRASEGHEQLSAKDAKMRHHAVVCQTRQDLKQHRIEVAGGKWIEQLTDLIVTGNLLHVEQGMGVILPFGLLQPALVCQKRRRLGEKDAKGAQGSVVDGVLGVGTRFAMVRHVRDVSVYDALEGIEA